jgi:hypothetical protein
MVVVIRTAQASIYKAIHRTNADSTSNDCNQYGTMLLLTKETGGYFQALLFIPFPVLPRGGTDTDTTRDDVLQRYNYISIQTVGVYTRSKIITAFSELDDKGLNTSAVETASLNNLGSVFLAS